MSHKIVVVSFASEEHLLEAVRAAREHHCHIVDIYSPYPVHGLEELLGWRRSWLPVAALMCGMAGVGFAFWFQFWTTGFWLGEGWRINVGGRPWNSLPAFVPVAFETMVLLSGFGVVLALLFRCGLYPGSPNRPPLAGLTDSRFALAVRDPGTLTGPVAIRHLFQQCHALELKEQNEDDLQS
jgi:hypothetical protein